MRKGRPGNLLRIYVAWDASLTGRSYFWQDHPFFTGQNENFTMMAMALFDLSR